MFAPTYKKEKIYIYVFCSVEGADDKEIINTSVNPCCVYSDDYVIT